MYADHELSVTRSALAELLRIVQHPDAPSVGNLPQVDLASKWYVRLASEVQRICESLQIDA